MGYETPNVVKTIIIPFHDIDNGLTFEEYKNKYGIDLEEVFEISFSAEVVNIFKRKNCIYYVSYEDIIYPMLLTTVADGSLSGIVCNPSYVYDNEKYVMSVYFQINADKTITYREL